MGSWYTVGCLVGGVIWGIIWGVVARAVVTNKGYADKGTKYFWLGFFFWFFPVIVAATKPISRATAQRTSSSVYDELKKLVKLVKSQPTPSSPQV